MTDATAAKPRAITISVNGQPVHLNVHKATGASIKATAITQGVAIEQDFMLFLVHGEKLQPIADDEEITLHPRQEFRAVAPDDNS